LGGPGTAEQVIIGKSLQSGGFTHGKATALGGIRVDIIMAVLAYVRDNGRGRAIGDLDTETIREMPSGSNRLTDIYVIGKQIGGEMLKRWRYIPKIGVARGIKVTIKIGIHMAARIVITYTADPFVRIP
jgi:hypothetical protein